MSKLKQHSSRLEDVMSVSDDSVSASHFMNRDSDSDTSSNTVSGDRHPESTRRLHSKKPIHQERSHQEKVFMKNTDSDVASDEYSASPSAKQKVVAIDISQNKHFTHRLLPVQSPEFDNVIDQVIFFPSFFCGVGGCPIAWL